MSKSLAAITVTGAYGKPPKVQVKTPWAIDKTRVKVLHPGNGATVPVGGSVEVNYHAVNGRTGKVFDDSFSRGQTVSFSLAQVVPGFKKGLENQKAGSRVVIAMPGTDGYDAQGGNPQAGIEKGDTLIFVVDIVATQLSGPQGKAVEPKKGLPTVTGDKEPKVTIPRSDPPKKLVVQPLIKGSGKKVTEKDLITVNYQQVGWSDGKVIDQTYGSQPQTGQLGTLISGWKKGLAGQTVGSRVLLVVPPSEGYPKGSETPKVDKGETLVFVIDILFTQEAPPGQ